MYLKPLYRACLISSCWWVGVYLMYKWSKNMVVRLGKILDSMLDEGESQIQASMALTVALPWLALTVAIAIWRGTSPWCKANPLVSVLCNCSTNYLKSKVIMDDGVCRSNMMCFSFTMLMTDMSSWVRELTISALPFVKWLDDLRSHSQWCLLCPFRTYTLIDALSLV